MRTILCRATACSMLSALALAGCNDSTSVPETDGSSSAGTETTETTAADPSGDTTTTGGDTDNTGITTPTSADTTESSGTAETGPDDSTESSTGELAPVLGDAIEIQLDVEFDPLAMDVADFDGDGALDVLVTGVYASNVTAAVLYGQGDGSFGPATAAGITGCSAYPAVGGLDGDNRADVVTGGCGVPIAAWQGLAEGGFGPWAPWSEEQYPGMRANVMADFGNDGNGDLFTLRVMPSLASPSIWIDRSMAGADIYHNSSSDLGQDLASGFDPDGLAVGNLDGELPIDLVLFDRGNGVARVLGSENTFADAEMIDADISPWTMLVVDVDGDDDDDVVVVSYAQESLQVLRNDGAAAFVADPPANLGSFDPYAAAAGDVDGDGTPDVVVVDDGEAWVGLARNDGSGGLTLTETRGLPSAAIRVHVADLDGNGRADIVAGTLGADSITVLLTPSG